MFRFRMGRDRTNKKGDRHVLFIINHAAFFASHRLPLARAAQLAGYRVTLITGQPASTDTEPNAVADIRAAGIMHYRTAFTSAGMNPVREGFSLLQIIALLLRLRPSAVHCASPKALMYGGIAARILRVPVVVLAVSGMGYAHTAGRHRMGRRVAAVFLRILGRWSYGNPRARVVVQNTDDMAALRDAGVVPPSRLVLVPGSGVDLSAFRLVEKSKKARLVLFPGRVLHDKGIGEFMAAAATLKREFPNWRFVVAGATDYVNPSAASAESIAMWRAAGNAEFLGHVPDIIPLMEEASIVCLPSYREGMPKALLEAAATGAAVVTTDAVGCREAVIPDKTGILVPPGDAESLTVALRTLMLDDARRTELGEAGRKLVEERFAMPRILDALLQLYKPTPLTIN
jgi:glycosyltransferase involved in cell wall biosynthesis